MIQERLSEPSTVHIRLFPHPLDPAALRDPREGWRVLYPLPEILLLVLCTMDDLMEAKL